MAFRFTTTGATDRSSIFRGDVGLISGTWSGSAETSGTIVTGGSTILAYDVIMGTAEIGGTIPLAAHGSATILSAKNETGNGDSLSGAIRVSAIDAANITGGDWWAVTRV